jgi:hypothetical protein
MEREAFFNLHLFSTSIPVYSGSGSRRPSVSLGTFAVPPLRPNLAPPAGTAAERCPVARS